MKHGFSLFLASFLTVSHLFCQTSLDDLFSTTSTADTTYALHICTRDTASLREAPTASRPIQTIHFGESVYLLDESIKLPSDSSSYHKVRSTDGQIGWLPDSILIPQGEVAVILNPMRIYRRPATPSTITNHECMPGERLIMTGQTTDWGASIISEKGIAGWVHDPSRHISTEIMDLELAKMMSIATLTSDSSQKRQSWHEIIDLTQQNQSEMTAILLAAYRHTYPKEELPISSSKESQARVVPPATVPTSRQTSEEFWDSKTNTWLTQIQESGPIQIGQLETQNDQLFQAAHKSLAIGTRILLAIPKEQGYVEIEITDSLPANSPYVLGLSQQMVDLFFGVGIPEELSIFYVKK